jgi:predicted RNA binding protein YcfA (HicA-like mRNA interferase family)
MSKLPVLTAIKLIKILEKKGFIFKRSSGSHQTYSHPITHRIISIPVHRGKDLGRGITKAIIADAGFTESDFIKLL